MRKELEYNALNLRYSAPSQCIFAVKILFGQPLKYIWIINQSFLIQIFL